jgi:hypothetical protein
LEAKTFLHSKKQNRWTLLVNEQAVEEASMNGKGLRDMRGLKDGSYTIATGFSCAGIKRHACRKFRFKVGGVPHEVIVAHVDKGHVWQVSLDGKLVGQERHGVLDTNSHTEFEVPGSGEVGTHAVLEITWSFAVFQWHYRLTVGDMMVPVAWTSGRGKLHNVASPEVLSGFQVADQTPTVSDIVSSDDEEEDEAEEREEQVEDLRPLPQGVSYDKEAAIFQATVKDAKTGRFILLGEFNTMGEAHQTYLEAVPVYAPNTRLAPPAA